MRFRALAAGSQKRVAHPRGHDSAGDPRTCAAPWLAGQDHHHIEFTGSIARGIGPDAGYRARAGCRICLAGPVEGRTKLWLRDSRVELDAVHPGAPEESPESGF